MKFLSIFAAIGLLTGSANAASISLSFEASGTLGNGNYVEVTASIPELNIDYAALSLTGGGGSYLVDDASSAMIGGYDADVFIYEEGSYFFISHWEDGYDTLYLMESWPYIPKERYEELYSLPVGTELTFAHTPLYGDVYEALMVWDPETGEEIYEAGFDSVGTLTGTFTATVLESGVTTTPVPLPGSAFLLLGATTTFVGMSKISSRRRKFNGI